MAADRAFARAVAENGTEGWVMTFAADGMMFNGSQPVVGHDAIRGFMGPAFDSGTFTLTWDPLDGEISASGDLGYTRGRWESRQTASDGSETVGSGTYVTIWRRDADGQWRVTLDIGAPDVPEESGAE
jgi:ketosteroid isomerase-like protein